MVNFVKSLKNGSNLENFWKIFYRVKWNIENFGKISWNLWEVENFGKKCEKWSILLKVWKIDKFRQIWKMFFPRIKWNIENFWKISWNLCKVEKFGKKCDKLQILLKVWKVAKILKNLKNILPREMKNWKFLKNQLEFVGSGKIW